MNPWSNIECPEDDPEIVKINALEESLGELSEDIRKIRELITGFEVCHFKIETHLDYIKKSISSLKPFNQLKDIGKHHIRHGESASKKDRTGRSIVGQQYITALNIWLDHDPGKLKQGDMNNLVQQVVASLGEKDPEKIRLVHLLVARLLWNWDTYEELLKIEGNKELEFQVCRMDICHYAFPDNIDVMLEGIGKMKPVESFVGCGIPNPKTRHYIEEQFGFLVDKIESENGMRSWLYACMAKTLKEQVGLTIPVPVS